MSKNTLAFISVAVLTLLLPVAHFMTLPATTPVAPAPQIEQPLQRQAVNTVQSIPAAKVEQKSEPLSEDRRDKTDGQDQGIAKSTPTKVIAHYRTQQSARNIKFLTVYLNDIPEGSTRGFQTRPEGDRV